MVRKDLGGIRIRIRSTDWGCGSTYKGSIKNQSGRLFNRIALSYNSEVLTKSTAPSRVISQTQMVS